MILQILCFYLDPETLFHLFDITKDPFYYTLAEEKIGIQVLDMSSPRNLQDNFFKITVDGQLIHVEDSHANAYVMSIGEMHLSLLQVSIHNIPGFDLDKTLSSLIRYFKDYYVKSGFAIYKNDDTSYEIYSLSLQVFGKMKCCICENSEIHHLVT